MRRTLKVAVAMALGMSVALASQSSNVTTKETAQLLAQGVIEEESGRRFEELTKERDAKLVVAMCALRGAKS